MRREGGEEGEGGKGGCDVFFACFFGFFFGREEFLVCVFLFVVEVWWPEGQWEGWEGANISRFFPLSHSIFFWGQREDTVVDTSKHS